MKNENSKIKFESIESFLNRGGVIEICRPHKNKFRTTMRPAKKNKLSRIRN